MAATKSKAKKKPAPKKKAAAKKAPARKKAPAKKAPAKKAAAKKKAPAKKAARKAPAKKKAPARKAAAKKAPAKAPARNTAAVKEKMTKTGIMTEIAAATGLAKKEVESVLEELHNVIERHIKKRAVGEFAMPGLFKIKSVKKPASKARKGVPNPFKPGETMDIPAKPASVRVRVTPLKKLKDMASS